jgi:hypothetical protein
MTRAEKKEELIGLFSTGAIYLGDLIDECFDFAAEHPADLENTEGASLDALFDGDPVKEIDDIIDNLQK